MHDHLRQLFDAGSAGRDNPGSPPRGLCAVGWNGAAGPDLGRSVHYMVRLMSDAIMGELLRRVPIFAGLSPTELAEVVGVARSMPKRNGARIFEEGSPPDCCLVLTDGRAKVV